MLAQKKRPGFTWNPGGAQITLGHTSGNHPRLLAATDFLLLNKGEAMAFTGKGGAEEAIKELIHVGVRIVCVTDGKNGALSSDGKMLYHCPIQNVKPVDTTGAGDAFGTGATWALCCGRTLPKALLAGTINAMSVVGAIGAEAGLLTETEMLASLLSTELIVSERPL